METRPKLSICIPTYNRETYLKELLDSIVCQNEFINTDEVEIIVDDGPSSDNTELMVKKYIKKYGDKIKYYRNPVNIGMCPAFLEAFSFGNGEYCWIFSSDDLMTKDTLKITLNLIKQYSPCLIFGREITKGKEYKHNKIQDIRILKGMNDFSLYISNCEEKLFKQNTDIFTFISLFCTRKEFFEKNLKTLIVQGMDMEDIKKNYFNFSLIGFAEIFSEDAIIIIEHPTFVLYTGDNGSRKPNTKIIKDLRLLINVLKKNYTISPKFEHFLNKMYFARIIEFTCRTIVPYAKKLGIYSPLKYLFHKIYK